MTDGAFITVDGLGVRYPGRPQPALEGVSFVVSEGETVAVTGRTGAGKSTLALACGGFIPRVVHARVQGSVRIGSILATTTTTARQLAGEVGIVFSTPAHQLSASKLTVREELAFGLENLGVPREAMDVRIDATLHSLGIEHLAVREPLTLSGGEQQRVAIASIVVMGPKVLVLDEPVAQLDPGGAAVAADLLRRLTADGSAVLCAEHSVAILGAATKVLLLESGRPAAFERPGAVLGSGVLGPLGLPTPTLVRLSEVAGVPPDRAFDEAAIAAALSARRGGPGHAGWLAVAHPSRQSRLPRAEIVEILPSTTEEQGIEVSALVHRYPGGVEAVRGVDLVVRPGETVSIVGQNGSGKTTLVRHFNGLLRPTSGRITVGGDDIASRPVSTLARVVGFVFQNPDDQLFQRTVEREVLFGPRQLSLGAQRIEERVRRALAVVGLEAERITNPYDLGFSTRKLVALASVLAMEPGVLVLDEPTTGQDALGVALIGSIVRAWAASGRSVVAITHDMEFAARYFARIVVMSQGEVTLDGPPARIFMPDHAAQLASTGLIPPPAARIAGRLGLNVAPADADSLLSALAESMIGSP